MEAFILLGSNIGQREREISNAIELLIGQFGKPLKQSGIYASTSWGFEGNEFLNQVVVFYTQLSPTEVLQILLDTETILGRRREPAPGYSDRSIDIDLLYLDSLIFEGPELTLPHPRLHLRRFTLVPLNEVAPDMLHPRLLKTHKQLLSGLDDATVVWPYKTGTNG
jgi:2-amino-4-hydroxy-6-hydroxymethyldihydropteridine diphosphokinase